jgi:hypothetical protein
VLGGGGEQVVEVQVAGTASSSSASGYGDVTVRSCGLRRVTSEPSPARVGRNGSRSDAAYSAHCSMPSSYSVTSIAPDWRAAWKCGSSGIESSESTA